MNIEIMYISFFIIYYLIATFFFCNILYNPRFNLKLINKKTKEQKKPSIIFIIIFSLFWIISIPLSINKGENDDERPNH